MRALARRDRDATLHDGYSGVIGTGLSKRAELGASRYWNPKRVAQLIALVLSVVAVATVLFVPSYTFVSSDSNGNETIGSRTVWDVNGSIFLLVMAIPVAIAIMPLLLRGRAWLRASVTAL